jgi:hypothetical protein
MCALFFGSFLAFGIIFVVYWMGGPSFFKETADDFRKGFQAWNNVPKSDLELAKELDNLPSPK